MGGGTYSSTLRATRAKSLGYHDKARDEIFTNKSLKGSMDPEGITLRESRDSDEHPNSVPIILALDVTGSMGGIPHHLVKDGLPTIMSTIIQNGIKDPQLLFLAIGDHETDNAPLQVAQFESSDELLDKWLTDVYLEGHGGANAGESYLLAWYFAGHHTQTDSFEKRGKKGFLFTVGDEPTLKHLPEQALRSIMGPHQHGDFSAEELLVKANELYHVYHIHIKETYKGSMQSTIDGWKQLIGDNLIVIGDHNDLSQTVAETVVETLSGSEQPVEVKTESSESPEDSEDVIL